MMVRESQIRCAHIICKLPANIYRHSRRAVRNPEPLARLRRPFEKFGGVVATSEFKMMLKTQLVLAPRPFKLPAHHHSILSGLIRNPEPLAGLRQLPTRQVSKSDRLRLRRIDAAPSARLRVRPEHCDGRASVCGASGQDHCSIPQKKMPSRRSERREGELGDWLRKSMVSTSHNQDRQVCTIMRLPCCGSQRGDRREHSRSRDRLGSETPAC